MWSCALALLAVAAFAAGDEQLGAAVAGAPGLRGLLEPRLAATAYRLGRLEKQIEETKRRIEEARKVDPQGFLFDLHERIDHVEAVKDHCDSNKEIRCGHETLECVNTLLLCDGQKDCHNGWDENEKTCSAGSIKAGSVFSGTATWVSCRNRLDHPVTITITGTYKANFFGPRLGVRGTVSADLLDDDDKEHHHEFDVKGYYVYGKKRLALFPADDDVYAHEHLGVLCDFVHGNDATAECIFTHEGSLHTCAKIHVSLQS